MTAQWPGLKDPSVVNWLLYSDTNYVQDYFVSPEDSNFYDGYALAVGL